MTLQQLLSDVIEITKRPDARARSLLALNTIIAEIVTNYNYSEDLIEETVTYQADSPQVVIPSPTVQPIRAIEWLQVRGQNLRATSPREISKLPCAPVNVFYRSGSNLVINSSYDSFSEFRIGYYATPPTLREVPGSDTHWLLDKYPTLLLAGTVARTFKSTGDDDSAVYYEREFLQLRAQIRRTQLEE